ncbi:MAG: DUF4097 family beta strand repeat-containing protein [Vulcanimicrobiaceae bacterium]
MPYRSIGLLLLTALGLASCGSHTPYITTTGTLPANAIMTVEVAHAEINAYKPAAGDPADRFTVSATALGPNSPAPPTIRRTGNGIVVDARAPLRNLLVRVPTNVNLNVDSRRGDVDITEISGNADVHAGTGSVDIMIAGYAQASVTSGQIAVTMGSTSWPGVLEFRNGNGDVEVWVTQTAKFRVHLHTDDGTLFTDFPLRGTASGKSETIDGVVNGGADRAIDIEVERGDIRLLSLHPEP